VKLSPFFSFFGAKHRTAPRYPSPDHRMIVEPFAGSAGYSSAYADRDVVLVERDPIIAALWRFLIGSSSADILALPLLEDGQKVSDLEVSAEARTLIGFWCNKGATRPCNQITTTWGKRYPNQFWHRQMRGRVARQVNAIRHWRVVEGDYSLAPVSASATYFVDPPYIGRSRTSKWRGGSPAETRPVGDRYRFNTKGIDYAALGAWCAHLPGQVIACENVGADWLPFRPFFLAKSNNAGRLSAEAIWCNGRYPGAQAVLAGVGA
jgi:hypothetical protein